MGLTCWWCRNSGPANPMTNSGGLDTSYSGKTYYCSHCETPQGRNLFGLGQMISCYGFLWGPKSRTSWPPATLGVSDRLDMWKLAFSEKGLPLG